MRAATRGRDDVRWSGTGGERHAIARLARLVAAAALMMAAPAAAFADACSDEVDANNRVFLERAQNFKLDLSLSGDDAVQAQHECEQARRLYQMDVDWLPREQRAEALCGGRLRTTCNAACWSSNAARDKAAMDKDCARAARLAQPIERAKSLCFATGDDHPADAIVAACGAVVVAADAAPKDRAEAFIRRAGIFDDRKEADAALADYADAIRAQPQDARYLYLRALFDLTHDRRDAALPDLTAALALDQGDPDIWQSRAELYERRDDYAAAIADLDHAITAAAKAAPKDADRVTGLLLSRAHDLMMKGDLDRAAREYKAAGRRGGIGNDVLVKMGLAEIEDRRHGPVAPKPMDAGDACATLNAYVKMGAMANNQLVPLLVPLCNTHADAAVPCATLKTITDAGVDNPGLVCKR